MHITDALRRYENIKRMYNTNEQQLVKCTAVHFTGSRVSHAFILV